MNLLAQIRDDMAFEANIWKSYLYRFLMNFQLWWPIWVIYLQEDRGLSLTQITLLDAPFFLLIVLAEIPTGAIADRFGRRTSLMLGSGMFALAVAIFGVAENYGVILLAYTAWGLGLTFQSGADSAILYDSMKRAGREDEFQKVNSRLWALTSLAVLLAILIGAPIAAATSYSVPILMSAVIAMCAIPVAFLMHEPREFREEENEPYLSTVTNGIKDAWAQPPLRYIILFSAIIGAAVFTPLIFVQPFLNEHGVDTGNLGVWQAPVRAAGIVAALLTFRVVSRIGQRASFFALPLSLSLGLFVLGGFDARWAYLGFLPLGMVAGSQNPVLASYVNQRIPSARRATMLSVQSVIASMMLGIVEPIGGLLADNFGLQAMFMTFGFATLIAGTGTLMLWSRAEAKEDERAGDEDGPMRSTERERRTEAVAF